MSLVQPLRHFYSVAHTVILWTQLGLWSVGALVRTRVKISLRKGLVKDVRDRAIW